MTLHAVPGQIGRYQIISELGRGSMGHVYLALDPNIERRVALKILLPLLKVSPQEQAELRQRFLLEARAAGKLKHPGVVTLFDADTDFETGLSFIAMEWIDGPSLHDLIQQSGSLPIAKALDIIEQVALALDAAHKADLVHRDIKPANILLTAGGQAKVTDFGIAKLASMSLTATGWVPGSPFYMSPEQVRGQALDGRSDLYSLGVALYQCLTGEVPFTGESLASMTYMILEVDPRPPQPLNPRIPDELAAVMMKALRKSPAERFQSALEFAEALQRVPREELDEAPPPSSRPLRVESWTPKPQAVGTCGGESTTLLKAHSQPMIGPSEMAGSRSESTLEEPSSSARRWALPLAALLLIFLAGPVLRTAASPPEPIVPVVVDQTQPFRAATVDAGVAPGSHDRYDLAPPEPVGMEEPEELPAVTNVVVAARRPAPPRVAPTKPTVAAPPAVGTANLEIVFKNRLRKAEVSVWIDEKKVWSRGVEAPKSLFKRTVGRNVFTLLPVEDGRRVIDVRVIGSEGKVDVVRRTEADFVDGETKRLKVTVVPPKKLKISWDATNG